MHGQTSTLIPHAHAMPVQCKRSECEYAHILVPTNLRAQERSAALVGLRLARACQSKITFLRVLPEDPQRNSLHWLDAIDQLHSAVFRLNGSRPSPSGAMEIESSRTEIVTYLAREFPESVQRSVNVHAECRVGEIADEIARFADHAAADLVILSSELSIWGVPMLPAQVRRVLRLTRQSVVVVRSASERTTVPEAGTGTRQASASQMKER